MATIALAPRRGLTEREAAERAARGERNVLPPPTGRTYWEILRENVLTFINLAILGLGVALALIGEPSDALVSVGVVSVNVVVSVVQEVRAKRVLDRIALLVRPGARVLRDGHEREVAASDLVLGDVMRVTAGDQLLADGAIVSGGPLEMDESLLTGEAIPIVRASGDDVLSGTVCLSGAAYVETRRVGGAALANRLTAGARSFRRVATPLQRRIDLVIRAVFLVAIWFALVLVGGALVEGGPLVDGLRAAIVIGGLVPNGLLLASSAAYAMSAVRVARQGVLVQQANAIDSLSHVEVLCMDKTGTLTTGLPRLERLEPIGVSEAELRSLAGLFAACTSAPDRTTLALRAACAPERRPVRHEVPFSAARRWSAVVLDAPAGPLVLGAPEALAPHVAGGSAALEARVSARTAEGLRVLLLARSDAVTAASPGTLVVLGLVCLAEQLRPDARSTVERFSAAGIAVKLISGDHPNTVASIARAAGVDTSAPVIVGDELDALDDASLGDVVRRTTIFARTTPHQKERVMRALRRDGRYTAMVGDGVNDVLALKAADLGIALRGGAGGARAVADMILLRDEVAALAPAAAEGHRILRGMRDILRIFLVRVLYAALVIAAVAAIDGGFPFTPKQNALLTLVTVGIPSLFLAAWAPSERVKPGDLGAGLARSVVPVGWTIAVIAVVSYVAGAMGVADAGLADATRSTVTTVCVVAGLVFFVLVDDEPGRSASRRRRDRWRAALGALLLAGYVAVLAIPAAAAFFDLRAPAPAEAAAIAGAMILWTAVLHWSLRTRALDVLLGLPRRPA